MDSYHCKHNQLHKAQEYIYLNYYICSVTAEALVKIWLIYVPQLPTAHLPTVFI